MTKYIPLLTRERPLASASACAECAEETPAKRIALRLEHLSQPQNFSVEFRWTLCGPDGQMGYIADFVERAD